jgi:hypothetical protein
MDTKEIEQVQEMFNAPIIDQDTGEVKEVEDIKPIEEKKPQMKDSDFWEEDNEEALYTLEDKKYFESLRGWLKKITDIVIIYTNESERMKYEDIVRLRDEASGYKYFLAGALGNVKKKYNIASFIRDVRFNRQKQAIMKRGASGVEAEAVAKNETANEKRKEKSLEAEAYQAELLLDSLDGVLHAMASRLKMIEFEKIQSKKQV